MFDGENQVCVRRDGVRDLDITLRVLVEFLRAETPGSADDDFIQLLTNHVAKYFQQFDAALLAVQNRRTALPFVIGEIAPQTTALT